MTDVATVVERRTHFGGGSTFDFRPLFGDGSTVLSWMPPELRDVVHTRRLHCDFQVALTRSRSMSRSRSWSGVPGQGRKKRHEHAAMQRSTGSTCDVYHVHLATPYLPLTTACWKHSYMCTLSPWCPIQISGPQIMLAYYSSHGTSGTKLVRLYTWKSEDQLEHSFPEVSVTGGEKWKGQG